MLDTRHQPVLESLLERLGAEINARAVLLLHENGQVIQRSGWIGEHEYPAMAALVAAMIATGKSLSALGENFAGSPNRFACDSEEMGLYVSFVGEGIWLTALYEQPMNPGLFRMKVRRYAEIIARIGASKPVAEAPKVQRLSTPSPAPSPFQSATAPAGASASSAVSAKPASTHTPLPAHLLAKLNPEPQAVTGQGLGRAASAPSSAPLGASGPTQPEKFTDPNAGLFNNITDDEIDRLFDDASS